MNGQADEHTDGKLDKTEKWTKNTDEGMDRWTDKRMNRQIHGGTDG